MMKYDALDLLAALRAAGLALSREGDSLRVRPSRLLDEARWQAIRTHKCDLLAALDAERVAREIISRAAGCTLAGPARRS